MAAHQPNFMPYLGFFDKLKSVDEIGTEPGVFIIRDDCQYVRRDYHHRNRIRTNTGEGWMWLYVPVEHEVLPLNEVVIRHDNKINGREQWTKFHLRMIHDHYKRTPFFNKYYPGLETIYSDPGNSLCDFNKRLIVYLAECFNIRTKVVSFFDIPGSINGYNASETLANMARAVGADIYLSGDGGRSYLDRSPFGDDVRVVFQEYKHPVYVQRYQGFVPYLSAIDALFNIDQLPQSGTGQVRINELDNVRC
jgi:hypothetical protein